MCVHSFADTSAATPATVLLSFLRNGCVPSLSCFALYRLRRLVVVLLSDSRLVEEENWGHTTNIQGHGFPPSSFYLLLPKYWQIGPSGGVVGISLPPPPISLPLEEWQGTTGQTYFFNKQ